MATFTNQASITLGDNVTNSNVVTGEITTGVTVNKTVATTNYALGDSVTYVVTINNATGTPYNALTLTDDLGAFTVGGNTVVPLDYIEGSLLYYINGVQTVSPGTAGGPPLAINGINVPAGGTVTLIYEGRVNAFAPLDAGSVLTNTVTLDLVEDQTASATIPVREEVRLSIAKAVCPAVITNGDLTYTFIIQNTGNLAVNATDGLIVSDVFDPILTNIAVTLNGTPLEEGTGYTYNEATGEFATVNGAVGVDAATYTRDTVTGATVTTPGAAVITVTGTA